MATHTSTAPADGAHAPSMPAAYGAALRDLAAGAVALETAYRAEGVEGIALDERLRGMRGTAEDVVRRIADLPCSTLDGLAAKAAALAWLDGGAPDAEIATARETLAAQIAAFVAQALPAAAPPTPTIGRDLVDLHDSLDRIARRCAGVSLALLSLTPETREPLTMLLEDVTDSLADLGERLGVIREGVSGR
ncbi:hypothetical protein [Salinarimonas sp.]|uniref:hypothetical protein n=1 Tax=Salinarimonas sp. TaxID=2766526 RepID=UPI0032D90BFE